MLSIDAEVRTSRRGAFPTAPRALAGFKKRCNAGCELLAESQRDFTPGRAAARLRDTSESHDIEPRKDSGAAHQP